MVQIKEFRIVMPVSVDEYRIAQTYMVMKMQQQDTTGNEGVEILENKSFEDDVFGKGQYTSKLYRLQSKVPTWLSAIVPADALLLQEGAWDAYPRCKTVIKCPYYPKFLLTIETIHMADNGNSENVHGLSKELLKARKVETIDIASTARDYWSNFVGPSNINLSEFRSSRTARGPLSEGWQDRCDPVMTAYKLVTIDVPFLGFKSRLEHAVLSGERALFLESHKNCFAWIDEWFGMTMEQIQELERQNGSSLNKEIIRSSSKAVEEDLDATDSSDSSDLSEESNVKRA
ncbi:phosphatidylinositol transfer protein 1-like [Macadamia integrifolia]|uniref:phosphatidylinositol transfer protein 1-like n=1 Tax=Macadamia integrifolia TaxID=60698 RepID=UPI001C4FBBF8|nr:phosphatidylinositol transfer protein 1-like [Macadamia integrifolia]